MSLRTFIRLLRKSGADALRLSYAEWKPLHHPRLTFAWAYIILMLVSFAMLYLGTKIDARGLVLTRFLGAGQAGVTARIAYPQAVRDQIEVVLYDEQFLRAYDSAWPISYQEHADWLLRLAGQPGARPKAIFLDITFGQERNDPTLPALKKALCTLRDTLHVPVFLAALPNAVTGRLAVREGLGNCFTMVGSDYTPDHLDGYAWTYPLTRYLDDTGWKHGLPKSSTQPAYRSAAMAIALEAGRVPIGEETVPMSLVWGQHAAPNAALPLRDQSCVTSRSWFRNLAPAPILQFFDPLPPLCPYHRTLSMEQVGTLPDAKLATELKDRYVMVGANIPGHNDFANSPVHGLVPGVHYHAMALDNLLTYRAHYKRADEWDKEGLEDLFLPGAAAIFVVLAVRWIWIWLLDRLTSRSWWTALKTRLKAIGWLNTWDNEATKRGRTGIALLAGTAWALRLTLQWISAAALIAGIQTISRAGMLPITELISMTLFAEAFDYLEYLRWYVLGKEASVSEPEAQRESAAQPQPTP